jgi:hypothetical protein
LKLPCFDLPHYLPESLPLVLERDLVFEIRDVAIMVATLPLEKRIVQIADIDIQ